MYIAGLVINKEVSVYLKTVGRGGRHAAVDLMPRRLGANDVVIQAAASARLDGPSRLGRSHE